jgi:bloom syndrome protein
MFSMADRFLISLGSVLFYQYKDKKTLEMMIRKSAGNSNSQSTRRKIDQLYTCLRYCEDTFECRRTLQLQFFGEKFDSKKCTGCDNCRAGNAVDRRNMTPVAREILGLLSSLEAQKNGRGVTLLALSELWRGTKAKSHTKFLNIDGLTGYGNGSKYSKQDIDTITHAMVFETVLEEIAEATVSGFAADYIRPGPKSQALLAGSYQFFVRFAAKKAAPEKKSSREKKNTQGESDNKQDNDDEANKKPKAIRKSTNTKKIEEPMDLLRNSPESESSADGKIGAKRTSDKSALPKKHTDALLARIKKLVNMWAEEVCSII